MSQVTLHAPDAAAVQAPQQPAPAPKAARPADGIERVTDSRGRVIGVRRFDALTRARLFRVLGKDLAENGPLVDLMATAFTVAELDGEAIPTPASVAQIEALIARLGDEGLEASGLAQLQHQGISREMFDEAMAEHDGNAAAALRALAEKRRATVIASAKN